MSFSLTIKNIRLSQVDFNNDLYVISPARSLIVEDRLRKSVSRYGILNPPVMRETGSDSYAVVAGRKRLLALDSLDTTSVCSCLVIPVQVPETDVFHILLEEILLQGGVTPVEKAIFLQKVAAVADEPRIIREFLPRLELEPDRFAMKQALMLLDLEERVLQGIHEGLVHERVGRDLVSLAPRDRAAIFTVIAALRPSVSNQKKLLTVCRELAGREGSDIATLLASEEVQAIVQHQGANPPQKTRKLMRLLARLHMPRSGQAEAEFRRFVSALQLPPNVAVAHTPHFEDDAVTLSITFRHRKSLQSAWEKIRHATDNSQT